MITLYNLFLLKLGSRITTDVVLWPTLWVRRPVWSRHRALSGLLITFSFHWWDSCWWFVLLNPPWGEVGSDKNRDAVLHDWIGRIVTLISAKPVHILLS
jgi:hypothetical protein